MTEPPPGLTVTALRPPQCVLEVPTIQALSNAEAPVPLLLDTLYIRRSAASAERSFLVDVRGRGRALWLRGGGFEGDGRNATALHIENVPTAYIAGACSASLAQSPSSPRGRCFDGCRVRCCGKSGGAAVRAASGTTSCDRVVGRGLCRFNRLPPGIANVPTRVRSADTTFRNLEAVRAPAVLARHTNPALGRTSVALERINLTNNTSSGRAIGNLALSSGTIAVDGANAVASISQSVFFFNTGPDTETAAGGRIFATPAVGVLSEAATGFGMASSVQDSPPLTALTPADTTSLPTSMDPAFLRLQQVRARCSSFSLQRGGAGSRGLASAAGASSHGQRAQRCGDTDLQQTPDGRQLGRRSIFALVDLPQQLASGVCVCRRVAPPLHRLPSQTRTRPPPRSPATPPSLPFCRRLR